MNSNPSPTRVRSKLHFVIRAAERGLRSDLHEFVMTYGWEFQVAGATHLLVLRRRLPIDLRDTEIARRARGWIVVLGDDGIPMTCYRRFDAPRALRRKPKVRAANHRDHAFDHRIARLNAA